MWHRGTDYARIRAADPGRRGMALAATLVVLVGMMGLILTSLAVSRVEVEESRSAIDEVRTRYLSDTALERGRLAIDDAIVRGGAAPLRNVLNMFDGESTIRPLLGEQILDDGRVIGAVTVALTLVDQAADSLTIRIDGSAYYPDHPDNLGPAQNLEHWSASTLTLQYGLEPSQVFDYAYFINNWGWFYGNTINANGNVRSNGQFDAAGYKPTVNGQSTYDAVNSEGAEVTLTGYRDSNQDGLADGDDGGVWSGWDIVGAHKLRGIGGESKNQHQYDEQIPMPNLSDLSVYEQIAQANGSKVTVAGDVVSDAVYGDDPGERPNMLLIGTEDAPIELDGPIVIQGDLVIGGYVTGQGSFFVDGNVYVPDSIKYVDGPSSARPDSNEQEDVEEWLTDNWNKDFLGVFAAENIVVGDYTNSTWKKYVSGWMKSSLNKSAEDAGSDGIPNTKAGLDGILGTADDDVLEDDGEWTVEYYSENDAELGLVPPGFKVGDPIPGTGEDIDGDGVYDGTTTYSDLEIDDHLNFGQYGGTMKPPGIHKYNKIASMSANQLDGVFYTNHSFCWTVLGSDPATINGALISRNENIVYGTPSLDFNYDCRLLGGVTGLAQDLLPRIVGTPEILMWRRLDTDPNRSIEP